MQGRGLDQLEMALSSSVPIESIYLPQIDITGDIYDLEGQYFALGGFSDVYKAKISGGLVVAIKALRGLSHNGDASERFKQKLSALALQWMGMDHPNLMECLGICKLFKASPGIVMPMYKEPIIKYLERVPSVNPLHLLVQVAGAVRYMHSRPFVHGDIRAANILMSSEGTPILMDGGLSQIINCENFTSAEIFGPCRWMAPEILDPPDEQLCSGEDQSPYTKASDIYSLGMTFLEVMTGKVPFSHRWCDTGVVFDVMRGIRPPRPNNFQHDVWALVSSCWSAVPEERPTAELVQSWLETIRLVEEARNGGLTKYHRVPL
jgi:serine/threonine protein kinase